jgi:3-dehydroquinate synthase
MLKLWFILPDLPAPPVKPEQLIQTDFIFQYALAKLQICAHDLTDKGERRLLNLGHSFAHALETYSGFRIPHGRAVAWGLSEAALLSHRLKLIDDSALRDILSVIKAYGFARDLSIARDISFRMQLPELLRQDKKQTDEGYTLILFTGVRQVNVQTKVNLL